MNTYVKVMHTTSCNCASCASVPTLGIKMPYEEGRKEPVKTKKGRSKLVVGKNDLTTMCPKAAAMWSNKNACSPREVCVGSNKKAWFVCPDCKQEFETSICGVAKAARNGRTGCPVCAGQKVASGVNDLASQYPKAAAMWSNKNTFSPSEVSMHSGKKAWFVCPDCKQEFETKICNVVIAISNNNTSCRVCAGQKFLSGINDLATVCPKATAMWSSKNARTPSEVHASSNKKAWFVCPDCKQEFETSIYCVAKAIRNGHTGCPVCKGLEVVPGINDLASQCPQAAAMWSDKNTCTPSEVSVGSNKKIWFTCPDCTRSFESKVYNVVKAVENGHTGCHNCNMRRINAISKPEWFGTRFMLAFAGENGIANPFFDVRNILGENSRQGLDFVDHVQGLCYEYNGSQWHGDDTQAAKDISKFEAVHRTGYTMIRVLEPGLEVLDPKYDIVLPEDYYRNGKYNAEIMEEVGCKIIHLLEEIYGRKASPEIWALNNFEEFEAWFKTHKKELEAESRKMGYKGKGKTAAKLAA